MKQILSFVLVYFCVGFTYANSDINALQQETASVQLQSLFGSGTTYAGKCTRSLLRKGCKTQEAGCTTIPGHETCYPILDAEGNYLGENCIPAIDHEICWEDSCNCPEQRRRRTENPPRQNYRAYNKCMRQNRHVKPVSARIEKCAHLRP